MELQVSVGILYEFFLFLLSPVLCYNLSVDQFLNPHCDAVSGRNVLFLFSLSLCADTTCDVNFNTGLFCF